MFFRKSAEAHRLADIGGRWLGNALEMLEATPVQDSIGQGFSSELAELAQGMGVIAIDWSKERQKPIVRSTNNTYIVPAPMDSPDNARFQYGGQTFGVDNVVAGRWLACQMSRPLVSDLSLVLVPAESRLTDLDEGGVATHELVHVHQRRRPDWKTTSQRYSWPYVMASSESEAYDVANSALDPYYDGRLETLADSMIVVSQPDSPTGIALGLATPDDHHDYYNLGSPVAQSAVMHTAIMRRNGYSPYGPDQPPPPDEMVNLYQQTQAT